MKIIAIAILMISVLSVSANHPPQIFGYCASQNIADSSFSVSSVGGALMHMHTAANGGTPQVMAGMKYNLILLSQIFNDDMFVSKGFFADYVELRWYTNGTMNEYVDRFKIYRKEYGSTKDSSLVAIVENTVLSWRDEYAEANRLYEYTVYAEGVSKNFVIENINFQRGVGFRTPTGRVSGRITYEGGTAVENVRVISETDDELPNYSIQLDNNDYLSIKKYNNENLFVFDTAFTFQCWFKQSADTLHSILNIPGKFQVYFNGPEDSLYFQAGDQLASLHVPHKTDTFFHITASCTKNDISLLAMYSETPSDVFYARKKVDTQLSGDIATVTIGKSDAYSQGLNGYLKEIRLWHRSFDSTQIVKKAGAYISGEEKFLSAYFRVNEGFGAVCYDGSRKGFQFNENHLTINGAKWSTAIPLQTQLSYKGITDENGNYIISGIPYNTSGSTYRFTPMYGYHTFDPNEALLFIGTGENTHNNVNFTDKSSFPIKGNVKYRNTRFPVEGVSLLVDGNAAISDGEPVTTDAQGNFTVDVPIGEHYISLSKHGHVFDNEGRFPVPIYDTTDGKNTVVYPLFDFQKSFTFQDSFEDTTLVKVIGRVAGGPIEAAKKHLGKSINNLGIAEIALKSQKEKDLTDISSGENSLKYNNEISTQSECVEDSVCNERSVVGLTTMKFNYLSPKYVKIYPDSTTGEYTAYLLPEKYVVTNISAGDYVFGDEFKTVIDLTNKSQEIAEFDTLCYDTVQLADGTQSYRYLYDSIKFNHKHDFIYRVSPSIKVTKSNGDSAFWERSEIFLTPDNETIAVDITDGQGNPLTKYPVFKQLSKYKTKISVFEQYNRDGRKDIVPVTDGSVEIRSNISNNASSLVYALDENGQADYTFIAGNPNISLDGENSFTKTLSITSFTGQNGSIRTQWKPDNKIFRAYVKGAVPTGNNFITKGPDKIDMILRDPPGSNSYSYLEKGETRSSTKSTTVSHAQIGDESVTLRNGMSTKLFFGLGAGTIEEFKTTLDGTIGMHHEERWVDEKTTTETTTFTQSWQTSDDPTYVGSKGDLLVGHSTNIVYGKTNMLQFIPANKCIGNCFDTLIVNDSIYRLGVKVGLGFSPEFSTGFIYTQNHIENYLIPSLKDLRALLFQRDVYESRLDFSDDDFATRTDTVMIKDGDSLVAIDYGNYIFHLSKASNFDSTGIDSAYFYTQQIEQWENKLKLNETNKLKHGDLQQNISYDAGVVYENSLEINNESSSSETFEFIINPSLATDIGFTVKGMGMSVSVSEEYEYNDIETTTDESSKSTTFGYVLDDGDQGDFLSVDVYKDKQGFGPVFKTLGGQTCCPYEGAELTKYYKPGTILSEASMQREVPVIEVENAIATSIPESEDAVYTLKLRNESESANSFYMMVSVVEESNPYGALLKIDGSAIGNGRMVHIPANETVTKTLSLEKVRPDVYEYIDVKIILHSICQFDPDDNVADISDTVSVSAYFQPVCSGVSMDIVNDQWVTNTITSDQMSIGISDYNLSHSSFNQILFQYKPSSSSQWLTDAIFYTEEDEYNVASEPKFFIDNQPSLTYSWDMGSLVDRNYDIRLKTSCADGSQTETEPFSGIKDMKRPKVFGTPQPADGILSAGDELQIQFNEPIESGLLTPYNFNIQGVLNGTEIAHNASIYFDGAGSYISIPNAISLAGKSFTVEFWFRPDSYEGDQCMFFMGESDSSSFQIGINNAKLQIKNNGQIITSTNDLDTKGWQHIAVAFDREAMEVEAYLGSTYFLENMSVSDEFEGRGKIMLGKSIDNKHLYQGAIHELRIWNKQKTFGEIYANMSNTLKGTEVGLSGYWPFDEAEGDIGEDKARSKQAYLNGTNWLVEPAGSALALDGDGDYLEMNTANSVIITDEMDYTVEFWFKSADNTGNATLFSSGKGDGSDIRPERSLSINMTQDGHILLQSMNNAQLKADDMDYRDGEWHHIAFVLTRNANAKLYIDSELKSHASATDFGGIQGVDMWIGALGSIKNPAVFQDLETYSQVYNKQSHTLKTQIDLYDSLVALTDYFYNVFMLSNLAVTEFDSILGYMHARDSILQYTDSILAAIDTLDHLDSAVADLLTIDSVRIAETDSNYAYIDSTLNASSYETASPAYQMDTLLKYTHRQYDALLAEYNSLQNTHDLLLDKYATILGLGGMYDYGQFFAGKIDEMRIWKLARTARQLQMDKNSKLKGSEIGLVAYYPFEQYDNVDGLYQTRTTLADNYIPPYEGWGNGGTATIFGDANHSADAPNMKDCRPVEKVAFDWAANEDGIILTVNEAPELIEKTILEITVENIEDLHENRIASPVTWTAFISKNQVKWNEDYLNFEKELYEELSFEAELRNSGGKQRNFELQNIPVWLTAEPQQGTISPESNIKIQFTVNPALNIGAYAETIYLDANEGTPEPLNLDLKVYKVPPVWKVDASNYAYSMNVIGQISVDGIISTDESDMVAVFVNGKCRGVAQLQYISAYDLFEVFLPVYSNSNAGEKLEFRVWNASEGTVHTDIVPTDMLFVANKIEGKPNAPLTFIATNKYKQDIPLKKGWNWISFNLNSPALNSVDSLLNHISAKEGDMIKSRHAFAQLAGSGNNAFWDGSLSLETLGNDRMYMLQISETDTLSYYGSGVNPKDVEIRINPGWNWISYVPQFVMTVDHALAQFNPQPDDVIKSQSQFAMYVKHLGWIGNLDYFAPGLGYMYLSENSDTASLVYPEKTLLKSEPTICYTEIPVADFGIETTSQPTNMNMIIAVAGNFQVSDSSVLVAYTREKAVGLSAMDNTTGLFFTTVYASDNDTLQFRLFDTRSKSEIAFSEQAVYTTNGIIGNYVAPFELTRGTQVNTAIRVADNPTMQCNPVPFTESLRVEITLPKTTEVSFQIVSISGEIIYATEKTTVRQGVSELIVPAYKLEKLSAGAYTAKLKTQIGTIEQTIVKEQ